MEARQAVTLCHFERSEKSSLPTGQIKNVRGAVNTVLHTTRNDGLPHMYGFPACKKDPSAALGMTKREDRLSYISFHPAARANLRPEGADRHWRYERQMRKTEKCAAHAVSYTHLTLPTKLEV